MITLSNCHHNSPGPMFTDRAINPWISHGLGQRNLSVSISVWMCTYILVWTWVTGCAFMSKFIYLCMWLYGLGFVGMYGSLWVHMTHLYTYVLVNLRLHTYFLYVCCCVGGRERLRRRPHLFVHSKNIRLGDEQARLWVCEVTGSVDGRIMPNRDGEMLASLMCFEQCCGWVLCPWMLLRWRP